jgi:hypothetical protein
MAFFFFFPLFFSFFSFFFFFSFFSFVYTNPPCHIRPLFCLPVRIRKPPPLLTKRERERRDYKKIEKDSTQLTLAKKSIRTPNKQAK